MIRNTLVVFLLFFFFSFSKEIDIKKAIDNLNFDQVVLDICIANQSYCKIITDKQIYTYLKSYYKPALYTIAQVESKFKYKQGLYDKNDISYFQINKRIWNYTRLKKYNIPYSYYQIKHNSYYASEVALKIWLINIAQYILTYNKYPKSLVEYISLYHRIDKVCYNYKMKVRKVIYKNIWRYRR